MRADGVEEGAHVVDGDADGGHDDVARRKPQDGRPLQRDVDVGSVLHDLIESLVVGRAGERQGTRGQCPPSALDGLDDLPWQIDIDLATVSYADARGPTA